LIKENYTDTGEIAVLHFHVLDSAKVGLSEISIDVSPDNTFDTDYNDVHFNVVDGGVNIMGEITTTTTTETTFTSMSTITTAEITSTSTSTSTITTTEITTTSTSTEIVSKNIASDDDLCKWSIKDYKKKTGKSAENTEITVNQNGMYEISITDNSGNLLDTYTINPENGKGKNSKGEEVNLPQTGNNSVGTAVATTSAFVLTITGVLAIIKSGIFNKKRENE
jgi:predicted lactoylglutathione lyase